MIERINYLFVTLLVFSPFLLLSCSSSARPEGAQNAPAAPAHVHLALTAQGLQVEWEPVEGATHYTLFWGLERGDYKSLIDCGRPSVVLRGLKNGELFFFAVTAWNQRGESNFSNEEVLAYDDGSGSPETYLAKGNNLMNGGYYASAQAYFVAAIRLDPDNPYGYQSRATLYEKIDRPDLAREDEVRAEKLFKQKRISLRQAGR